MPSVDFVAIDVETANSDCSSICQIGIVQYKNGKLVEEWVTYLDPEDLFSPINTHIHGITDARIKNAPLLPDIANQVYYYLNDSIAVCHTHFDRTALNQAFEKYSLKPPNSNWLDSARVARRTWEQFAWSGYGLANICNKLGYEFKHHDALQDAKAAAHIIIKAIEESGIDLHSWFTEVERRIKHKNNKQRKPVESNPDGFLYGTNIVFTGALKMPRSLASEIAANAGCKIQSNVTRSTNIVVVGIQDLNRLAGKEKSRKQIRATELIEEGRDIQIINEKDFLELIDC